MSNTSRILRNELFLGKMQFFSPESDDYPKFTWFALVQCIGIEGVYAFELRISPYIRTIIYINVKRT